MATHWAREPLVWAEVPPGSLPKRQNRIGLREAFKRGSCFEQSLGKGGGVGQCPQGRQEEVGPRVRDSRARTRRYISWVTGNQETCTGEGRHGREIREKIKCQFGWS